MEGNHSLSLFKSYLYFYKIKYFNKIKWKKLLKLIKPGIIILLRLDIFIKLNNYKKILF